MWDWPDWPHDTLRPPFPPQHVPGKHPASVIFTVEVSLSSGGSSKRPLMLFLLLLRFLVSPAGCPFPAPAILITGKYFIAKLIPLNHPENPFSGCTGHFVSLKIPVRVLKHFRVSPYCYEFVKVHILPINIIVSRIFRLPVVSLPKST